MNIRSLGQEAGYSLVELMVVLLLLSFITLAIGGGMRFGTRVWESSETVVAAADHARATQNLVRELLGSAIPQRKGEYVEFEGTPSGMDFRAVAPLSAGLTGIVRVQLLVQTRDSAAALRIVMSKGDRARDFRETVLGSDAQTLRFAYLDASESVPAWLDRWRDRNRLPDAIRIAGDDETSRQSWPAFIVRLAIAQTPVCLFDPVSSDCRNS